METRLRAPVPVHSRVTSGRLVQPFQMGLARDGNHSRLGKRLFARHGRGQAVPEQDGCPPGCGRLRGFRDDERNLYRSPILPTCALFCTRRLLLHRWGPCRRRPEKPFPRMVRSLYQFGNRQRILRHSLSFRMPWRSCLAMGGSSAVPWAHHGMGTPQLARADHGFWTAYCRHCMFLSGQRQGPVLPRVFGLISPRLLLEAGEFAHRFHTAQSAGRTELYAPHRDILGGCRARDYRRVRGPAVASYTFPEAIGRAVGLQRSRPAVSSTPV